MEHKSAGGGAQTRSFRWREKDQEEREEDQEELGAPDGRKNEKKSKNSPDAGMTSSSRRQESFSRKTEVGRQSSAGDGGMAEQWPRGMADAGTDVGRRPRSTKTETKTQDRPGHRCRAEKFSAKK